jgi:two-component system LytT family response regulator
MMEMTCVIIDDEDNNIENLSILLKKHCPEVKIIGTAGNAGQGKELILSSHPELVFLDIQMPVTNGFGLLSSLNSYPFEIIFVTAYDKYALQAIKFSALDYLLKPIDTVELINAVEKAFLKRQQKTENLSLENLVRMIGKKENKSNHRIALQSLKETRYIEPKKIIRCTSLNNYTTFYLDDGETFITSRPIFEYEEILAEYGFFRSHQSHLVNLTYIKSIVKEDGGYILLKDSTQVPLSRNKREEIKNALLK